VPTPTRTRILDATAELFRRYGYTGTGLKQVVAAANAPFGSLYHHFPGGKQELGGEVIERSGEMYFELVAGVMAEAPDVVSAVEAAFSGAAEVLRATDYVDACPIATIALEVASTNDTLRERTAIVFERWVTGLTEFFVHAGIEEPRARPLAIHVICALEGAFILSRAAQNTGAMDAAGAACAALVAAAVSPPR
jgi:AcrR family transcriptional regulator